MHALLLVKINMHTEFQVPNFTHSKDMIGPQNLKLGHVTMTTPLLRVICAFRANTWCSLPCTKFDSNFSRSEDM